MQIMDQFGAAPGAESVRMPDGTERTLAAEHAAAILVNEQPAFRVVCTPELLPQLALGRLLIDIKRGGMLCRKHRCGAVRQTCRFKGSCPAKKVVDLHKSIPSLCAGSQKHLVPAPI